MFEIKSVYASDHDKEFLGVGFLVTVVVEMDSKEWANARKSGNLGHLYGVEISNAVYAINRAIPAINPTVDDTARASKGVKTIKLNYYGSNLENAEKLGLKVIRKDLFSGVVAFNTVNRIK
jgi:hypothetical protein